MVLPESSLPAHSKESTGDAERVEFDAKNVVAISRALRSPIGAADSAKAINSSGIINILFITLYNNQKLDKSIFDTPSQLSNSIAVAPTTSILMV